MQTFSPQRIDQTVRDVTTPWLSASECQNQLNLFDDNSQYEMLQNLELATRMAIEDYLGMAIFAQTVKAYYSANVSGTQIALSLPPASVQSTVSTVEFYDLTNTLTTLAGGNYFYDATAFKVVATLPTNINTGVVSPVVVTYSQAANTMAKYPVIKQAGLLLLTHLYNNRSETVTGGMNKIPNGLDALLRPYKPLVM